MIEDHELARRMADQEGDEILDIDAEDGGMNFGKGIR